MARAMMDVVPGNLAGAWTIIAPCLVFLACAYFTRAPVAKVLAALLSGVAVAGFNIAADVLADQRGWWRYPAVGERGFGPLIWYAGAGIGVSGLTLIAWRAHRRWGLTGTVVFLLALAAYGTMRDWAVSGAMRDLIVFGAGALPWVADYVAWLGCGSVAVAVQALLRGPPGREAPRPRRNQ
jgi:hypothetical protein